MSYRFRRPAATPFTFFSIGNSITARGNTPVVSPTYSPVGAMSALSYPLWASMLSNGALRFVGVSATPGYTTAQIKATHLPIALAVRPGICGVLAGINDINTSVPLTTTGPG
jgi:hypothetical protein